jgi:hypothetical protein
MQDMQRFPRGKDDFDSVYKFLKMRYARKFR